MHFAIIAAGEGSRLREEGITQPKPLIKLENKLLIERLIEIAIKNKAESITIVTNELYPELKKWADQQDFGIEFNLILKTTPSSMHSLYAMRRQLSKGHFCLATVDTIFDEKEFADYITFALSHPEIDALMAVTDYVDDEKPLWIALDKENNITAFESERNNNQFISGGLYFLTPKIFPVLSEAIGMGMQKMRNFQQELINRNFHVKAYKFSKIIDIDHASDIDKAKLFLKERKNPY